MKTLLKSVLTLGLVAGMTIAANAQKTSSAPASATILADLTIALDGTQNAISFGNISASTPGDIFLDPTGENSTNTGTSTNVARFNLGGADADVTVSYANTVTLTITGGGSETISMTPSVVGAALATEQGNALPVASGSQVSLEGTPIAYFLWVGGTIGQLTSKPTGTYAGLFNISVEYN
jgi:hypothetical protein